MDYVLFGMGYGATLMLLGWALRTYGPERKYTDIDRNDPEQQLRQHRWVRFIQGLGGVIAIGGMSMVFFTFVVMVLNPDDEVGAMAAYLIWGLVGFGVLFWCWGYLARYGLLGIWSREEGYGWQPQQNTSVQPTYRPMRERVRTVPPATSSLEAPITRDPDQTTEEIDLVTPDSETTISGSDAAITVDDEGADRGDVAPETAEVASDDRGKIEIEADQPPDDTRSEALKWLHERQERLTQTSDS